MNNLILYILIYLLGVIISSFAQILLKKASGIKKDSLLKEYLNFKTIFAYAIFFAATLCSVYAYKYLPLSLGPVLGVTEYIFVAALSFFFLKEKTNKKTLIGLLVILLGVIIYSV